MIELRIFLRELVCRFRSRHRVGGEGDRHGTLEQGLGIVAAFTLKRDLRQGILDHLQLRAVLAEHTTQLRHFRNRQTGIVGHDDRTGLCEHPFQGIESRAFSSFIHSGSPLRRPDHPAALVFAVRPKPFSACPGIGRLPGQSKRGQTSFFRTKTTPHPVCIGGRKAVIAFRNVTYGLGQENGRPPNTHR